MSNLQPIAVSATEAAKMLGISRTKLYQIAGSVDFPPSFHCGKRVLFSVAALQAWVNQEVRDANVEKYEIKMDAERV